jgi:hypothetical protein
MREVISSSGEENGDTYEKAVKWLSVFCGVRLSGERLRALPRLGVPSACPRWSGTDC